MSRALVLGRLARGLLHELANGSAAISGLAELSLEGLAPGSRDHQHVLLIRDAADAEAELVAAFRALSHSETPPGPLSVRDHAARAAEVVRLSAGRHVALEEAYEGDPTVSGDPARLEALVVHLLLDAYESLPDGGVVRLHATGGEAVTIAVEPEPVDEGRALARGTLGLAAARSLAESLGGTVERRPGGELVRLPSSPEARP